MVGDKYATQEGYMALSRSISGDEAKLQAMLEKASPKGSLITANKVSLGDMRNQAISQIENDFKGTGAASTAVRGANRIFDQLRQEYGDYITLADANQIKRKIRSLVNWNSSTLKRNVRYTIGQTFMDGIESVAQRQGIPEISQINQVMAQKLEAQKILKMLDKKSVQLTPLEKGARSLGANAAGVAGEFVGGLTGVPFAGTLAGRTVGRGLLNREPGTVFRGIARARQGQTAKKAGKALRGIATPAVVRTRETNTAQ